MQVRIEIWDSYENEKKSIFANSMYMAKILFPVFTNNI